MSSDLTLGDDSSPTGNEETSAWTLEKSFIHQKAMTENQACPIKNCKACLYIEKVESFHTSASKLFFSLANIKL